MGAQFSKNIFEIDRIELSRKELLKMLGGENDLYKEFEGDSEFRRCGFCHKKYFRKEFLRVPGFEQGAKDICSYCNGLNSMGARILNI